MASKKKPAASSKTKPATSKRAPLPRASDYTRQFPKDWSALNQSGRYDMSRLREAMLLLIANAAPLGPEWLDHELSGQWRGTRECHIGGDFLLVYQLDDEHNAITFIRAGTHATLFE